MANITNVVIACFDEEIKKITRKGFSSLFGENQVKVCNSIAELGEWIQDKLNIAIIFDKYFLGYVISYELLRLRFINKNFLTYFVDKGNVAHYFGMRIHLIGADGFIPNIEDSDAFKKSIKQVQSGVKVYPSDIQRSFDEDDYLLDKTYIDEVSIPEMHIGLFTSLGLSQKEISWNVGLCCSTVSEYTRKLRRKIGYSKPGDWDLLFKSFLTNLSGDFYDYKS